MKRLAFRKVHTPQPHSRMWDMAFLFSLLVLLILCAAMLVGLVLTLGLVKLGRLDLSGDNSVHLVLVIMSFFIVVSAAIGLLFAKLFSNPPLKPFRQLIDAIDRLARGDFSVRIHMNSPLYPYEFVQLTDSFNKMAEELGNTEILRTDFIHNFSHEFKTPINSMRGFAKLLQTGNCTPEEQQEYLSILVKESERLSSLATNVLNLTKIESQSIPMDVHEYNLAEQLRHTLLLLEPKWSAKDLELKLDIPDQLLYSANEDLLGQVWLNLLDNAVKFSPDGGSLSVHLYEQPGAVCCSIADQGIGMDAATQAHIFDKFYQGDTSHATEGNGIGLAIVQKIVTLYHGSIGVQSAPGEGSAFTVSLPR